MHKVVMQSTKFKVIDMKTAIVKRKSVQVDYSLGELIASPISSVKTKLITRIFKIYDLFTPS